MAQAIVTKEYTNQRTGAGRIKVSTWLGNRVYSWDARLDQRQNHAAAIRQMVDYLCETKGMDYKLVGPMACMPEGLGYMQVLI